MRSMTELWAERSPWFLFKETDETETKSSFEGMDLPVLPHVLLGGIGAGNYLNIESFLKFSRGHFNTELTYKFGQ